jgi:hypothetical protein
VSSESPAGSRTGGLQTALDFLIAPADGFERLREAPTWGWAYLIAAALSAVATLAILPALHHAIATGLPAQLAATPSIAKLPADQQQKAIAQIVSVQSAFLSVSWLLPLVVLPLVAAIQSLVMFVANRAGGGDAGYRRLWALAMNVQVAGSVGGLLAAAIVLLRGPNAFDEPASVQTALPSLALLAPGAPRVVAAFLGAINVAAIWQAVLLGLGMIAAARIARPAAWAAATIMLLTLSVLAAFGAAQTHAS